MVDNFERAKRSIKTKTEGEHKMTIELSGKCAEERVLGMDLRNCVTCPKSGAGVCSYKKNTGTNLLRDRKW